MDKKSMKGKEIAFMEFVDMGNFENKQDGIDLFNQFWDGMTKEDRDFWDEYAGMFYIDDLEEGE